jgi:hypothetical protein
MCWIWLLHYQTPTLEHYGSKWAYHFPEPRQVTIRCPQENGWTSHTVSLGGIGLTYNASICLIASQEIRTLPALSYHETTTRRPTSVSSRRSFCGCEPRSLQDWSSEAFQSYWTRLRQSTNSHAATVIWCRHAVLRASEVSTRCTRVLLAPVSFHIIMHFRSHSTSLLLLTFVFPAPNFTLFSRKLHTLSCRHTSSFSRS